MQDQGACNSEKAMTLHRKAICEMSHRLCRLVLSMSLAFGACGLSPMIAYADDAWGAELILLTIHLSDDTIQLGDRYKRKISSSGRAVITPGIGIYYDKALSSNFLHADQMQFAAAYYYDSLDHKSGILALLPRWQFALSDRLRTSVGLGPALMFRETWNTEPGYVDDGYFRERGDYQYKTLIGANIAVQYQLTSRTEFVWTIVPAIPYVITQSLGFRWMI